MSEGDKLSNTSSGNMLNSSQNITYIKVDNAVFGKFILRTLKQN